MQLTNKLKQCICNQIDGFASKKLEKLTKDFNDSNIQLKDEEEKLKEYLAKALEEYFKDYSNVNPVIATQPYRYARIPLLSKKQIIETILRKVFEGYECIKFIPLRAYKTNKKLYEYKDLVTETKEKTLLNVVFARNQEAFDKLMNEAKETLK